MSSPPDGTVLSCPRLKGSRSSLKAPAVYAAPDVPAAPNATQNGALQHSKTNRTSSYSSFPSLTLFVMIEL